MQTFLSHILGNTPIYVWAILAFLLARGWAATQDREIELRKLCIIPLVMLGLSLQDIAAKFGWSGATLGAWAVGALATFLPAWKFGAGRIAPGSAPGLVRVRGSWMPMVLMMAVFLTKYAVAVLLAAWPGAHGNLAFALAACALFGLFNGAFAGRLAADLTAWRALALPGAAAGAAAPAR